MLNFADLYIQWNDKFAPHLYNTARWDAFNLIAHDLFSRKKPVVIIETGCVRKEDNWAGDGQSTRVLSDIANSMLGTLISIDKDPDACALATRLCPSARVRCEDSIVGLSTGFVEKCDLLFLDSYDYQPPYALSELHHAGELAVAYERLPSGCLIAVDDCHGEWVGKHVMVKVFMQRMGIEPEIEGYITVWRKP